MNQFTYIHSLILPFMRSISTDWSTRATSLPHLLFRRRNQNEISQPVNHVHANLPNNNKKKKKKKKKEKRKKERKTLKIYYLQI